MSIKKLLLIVSLISSFAYGADFSVFPFASYSTYSGLKKDSYGGGLYANLDFGNQNISFGAEYRDTTYNIQSDDNVTEFDNYQVDTTLVYSAYISSYYKVDMGAHVTFSDLYQADTNQIYLIGFSFDRPYRFALGVDTYYSVYNDYSMADNVLEINPYYGIWHGERGSFMGQIYSKFSYYYTHPSNPNVTTLSNNYHAFEISFYQYKTSWTNSLTFIYGKNLNLAKDKLFTVYNNNELHDMGLNLSCGYNFTPNAKLKFIYTYERYDEYSPLLQNYTKSSKMNRFILSGTFNF